MAMATLFSPLWSLPQRCTSVLLHLGAVFILSDTIASSSSDCYTSIFSFGDSIADTGNLYYSSQAPHERCFFPPYGQTYFQHPTGRCSDGRLIIDFIAEYSGLPLVKPYLGIKNGKVKDLKFGEGVNFAVAGASALDVGFLEEKGIHNLPTNYSLRIQLDWFKEFLPSLCNSSSNCKEVLGSSLFLVGEIGGNDFNYLFLLRMSVTEIRTLVPQVINAISTAISELIDLGAQTLMVPGNFPLGCIVDYLKMYGTSNLEEYDEAGCLKWLNKFAEYYNEQLYAELYRLQVLHPHTNIIYADYYNAALPLYHSPKQFGFTATVQEACCTSRGPYNTSMMTNCQHPGAIACDDPSKYVCWDGLHLTEAAYRWIAKALLEGPGTIPNFSISCVSKI